MRIVHLDRLNVCAIILSLNKILVDFPKEYEAKNANITDGWLELLQKREHCSEEAIEFVVW